MNKLQILTGLALAIAASAQAPLPSPFQGGSGSGGGAPIAGATVGCIVVAATATTIQCDQAAAYSIAGPLIVGSSSTGAIDFTYGAAPSSPSAGSVTLFADANQNLSSETSAGANTILKTSWIMSDKGGAAADQVFIGNAVSGDTVPMISFASNATTPSYTTAALFPFAANRNALNASSEVDLSVGGSAVIKVSNANYSEVLGLLRAPTHGTNGSAGVATVSSGAVTVSTTLAGAQAAAGAAGYVYRYWWQTCTSTPKCSELYVSAISAGTSFTLTSSVGTDAGTVYWEVGYIN